MLRRPATGVVVSTEPLPARVVANAVDAAEPPPGRVQVGYGAIWAKWLTDGPIALPAMRAATAAGAKIGYIGAPPTSTR